MDLKDPWLVAVWPGMGHVAISAGYYMMAKLGMHQQSEFEARELFDLEHVEVKAGLIRAGALPRSRLFVWNDPAGRHDIVLFIGEAQPPIGRYAFCRRLIERARELGVRRVVTFAAMATQMHPEHESRVFVAATDVAGLRDIERAHGELLADGRIAGLNGVLLGVAAEAGLPGACLLGEMPHIFAHLPFPKASLAVLDAFKRVAKITLDTGELSDQARAMERELGQILAQVEKAIQQRVLAPTEEEGRVTEEETDEGPDEAERAQVERLFEASARDRSRAYELKRELDRLGLFREYEDRFLDLFKESP
jgi:proteasome assembly chaperone (PAC2) family protein